MLFLIITIVLIFITSAGIYYFENEAQPEVFKSVFHSAWWSIVTLTTVGYGTVVPTTILGKIIAYKEELKLKVEKASERVRK